LRHGVDALSLNAVARIGRRTGAHAYRSIRGRCWLRRPRPISRSLDRPCPSPVVGRPATFLRFNRSEKYGTLPRSLPVQPCRNIASARLIRENKNYMRRSIAKIVFLAAVVASIGGWIWLLAIVSKWLILKL
jgi:hypothetical protein